MKSHPVDFFFPTFPVPPTHAVIESTVIEIIAIFKRSVFMNFGFKNGQGFWKL